MCTFLVSTATFESIKNIRVRYTNIDLSVSQKDVLLHPKVTGEAIHIFFA